MTLSGVSCFVTSLSVRGGGSLYTFRTDDGLGQSYLSRFSSVRVFGLPGIHYACSATTAVLEMSTTSLSPVPRDEQVLRAPG